MRLSVYCHVLWNHLNYFFIYFVIFSEYFPILMVDIRDADNDKSTFLAEKVEHFTETYSVHNI